MNKKHKRFKLLFRVKLIIGNYKKQNKHNIFKMMKQKAKKGKKKKR